MSDRRKKLANEEHKYTLTDDMAQEDAADTILALIDQIEGNLNHEIKKAQKDEATAQLEYEKARDLMLDVKAKLEKKKTSLAGFITDAKKNRGIADEAKTTAEEDIADQAAFRASIQERCDYILSRFDQRVSDRESELDGLQRAKAILSGASLIQTGEQVPAKVEQKQEDHKVEHEQEVEQEQEDDKSRLWSYLGTN